MIEKTKSGAEMITAETAGFCFGVERAVNLVREQLASGRKPIYTYGPIIHNEIVVNELAEQGVAIIHDQAELEAAAPGTIVIRSHGTTRAEQDRMEQLGFSVADATCPFVKKIHLLVQEAEAAGKTVVIAGDPSHPEVQGICGWCKKKASCYCKRNRYSFGNLKKRNFCRVSDHF